MSALGAFFTWEDLLVIVIGGVSVWILFHHFRQMIGGSGGASG
ncbi:hypothetical protein HNQ76_002107 [Thermosulfuriphilus ammonigenes]|nr:hypothetical protein [Thermosulfuriphilus ammonigenes]MBA2849705.1 hypothetical protein [Thermosulfuriphilus ammonigenes]